MAIDVPRGKRDKQIDKISKSLEKYLADHPRARIALYRQNPVSIRVRVIDPDLKGLEKSERSELVWPYFDGLTEEEVSDISMLVLLTPAETKKSFANLEFEDPVSSDM